ncbi:unnamed protein product [Nyctereutes procyonoides]|uniref:(raccoon dog) hypothetical protein n=1 Tax=Nyctereutes procyonoides TaxID=34880 RepID=A0A811Z742_NYCPR|nr:unnamed protein product [Nyctereutes procyonoides]
MQKLSGFWRPGYCQTEVVFLPSKALTLRQLGVSWRNFIYSVNVVLTGQSGIFWSAPMRSSVTCVLPIPQRKMRERSRLHAGSQMWDSILGLWDHALSQRQTLNH